MRDEWIDNYAGKWADEYGRVFVITVRGPSRATVTLLVNGVPLSRPWCGNRLATDMPARLSPDSPALYVKLGRPGFIIELDYVSPYVFPSYDFMGEELSIGVGYHEEDTEAPRFIDLFSPLGNYRRADKEMMG